LLTFKIEQNRVRASGNSDQLAALRDVLTIPKTNAYWERYGDGKIRFFGWISKQFPYGLWPEVKHYCKSNRIEYKAFTARKKLDPLKTSKIGSIELDKDQIEASNSWLAARGSGIVWGGAGFGKTEIAASLISAMTRRGLAHRVLFIVNTLDLLDQAVERLTSRLKIKVGVFGGGTTNMRAVTVASIQSIDKGLRDPKHLDHDTIRYLKSIDMIVYDEVHHGRSEQSARLSKYCPAKYRLGLSARPLNISHDEYSLHQFKKLKAEDARVLSFLGPIIFRVKPSTLIKSGRLAKPTIYLYPLNYSDWASRDDTVEKLPWPIAREKYILNNKKIHRITRQCAMEAAKANETTLVIVGGSKKLGSKIYNELNFVNLNVAYLHGSVKKDVRTKSRHKLTNKKLEAIVATTIYDEGVDVPNLRLLVLAAGGLSPFKNEQRLGRGMRTKLGDNRGIVIDFMNYGNKHLRKHSYARLKSYLEEDQYDIKLVTDNHTPRVIKQVGAKNIVDALPNRKLFRSLGRGNNG
jgi:superfamily II DNA or RNA helicase